MSQQKQLAHKFDCDALKFNTSHLCSCTAPAWQKINFASYYRYAAEQGLVRKPDAYSLARARRAYRKSLADPGDCRDDQALLVGLAIAQADIGMRAGWIPEVQRVGCLIAGLPDVASLNQ